MKSNITAILYLFALQILSAQAIPEPYYNQLLRSPKAEWGFRVGDGTLSVALPAGKRLWIFADNMLGGGGAAGPIVNPRWLRNHFSVQDGERLIPLIGEADTSQYRYLDAFVKPPAYAKDSSWYWPVQGYTDLANKKVYVFMMRIKEAPGPYGFNFKTVGSDVVVFRLLDQYPYLKALSKRKLLSSSAGGIFWGASVLHEGGYTLVYGFKSETKDFFGTQAVFNYPYLARFKGKNPIAAKWQYRSASGWSYQIADAEPLSVSGLAGNTDESVGAEYSVVAQNGRYYLVCQELFFGRKTFVYRADAPWGPWLDRKEIYTAPENIPGHELMFYSAHAHPGALPWSPAYLLVSYNVNTATKNGPDCSDLDCIIQHPELYRPRFIRVNLEALYDDPAAAERSENASSISVQNPARGQLRAFFRLEEENRFDLALYDATGRLCRSWKSDLLPTGEHVVAFDLSDIQSGRYALKVSPHRANGPSYSCVLLVR